MLDNRCSGPIHRRDFLRIGSLAVGGIGLADVLVARDAARASNADTSVILVYCSGGASHLETYDLKPDGPELMRSVFRPIATRVPGMAICEHLPRHAQVADKFTVIRSLHHTINIHNDGSINVLTGKPPSVPDPTSTAKSEHPDFGMIASRLRGPHRDALPQYVSIPSPFQMTRPMYLGSAYGAFSVNAPGYRPQNLSLRGMNVATLDDRRRLLENFDRLRREHDAASTSTGEARVSAALDPFREQAYHVLTSPAVAQAFDLERESPALRDRYGRNLWGQSCLLARRLAEAGTTVISVIANVPQSGPEFTNWDDHPGNAMRPGHFAYYMSVRFPYFDHAVATLIEDVFARGLDRRIMVVVMGEFGRTPRIRTGPPDNSIGRDHWPDAYSALVSGGGLRMGQVIGSTNARGEYPTQTPLTPQDLLATMYRHLRIDPDHVFTDSTGRPIPVLPHGEVIRQLI